MKNELDSKQDGALPAWLLPEVEAGAATVTAALREFQATPGGESRLRCVNSLNQLRGCLSVAGCAGAVLVIDELNAVLAGFARDPARVDSDTVQPLLNGVESLVRYLEKVRASGQDNCALLLAVLNELRAMRHQPLFSETPLFAPDLSLIEKGTQSMPAVSDAALRDFVKNLRRVYQTALLGVIKGYSLSANLSYLEKTCTRLEELSARTHREYLWYVARTFISLLASKAIPLGVATRLLLRGLEREMQLVAEQGLDSYRRPYPKKLLCNLLYYIAIVPEQDRDDTRIVCNMFGLDDNQSRLFRSIAKADAATQAGIAGELATDLEQLRTSLNLIPVKSAAAGALDQLTTSVLAMADRLVVVSIPLRQVALTLADSLAKARGTLPLSEQDVSELSQQAREFDACVVRWGVKLNPDAFVGQDVPDEAEIEDSLASAAGEAATVLRKMAAVIRDYAGARDPEPLTPMPGEMKTLAASLRGEGWGQVGNLLAAAGDYLQCLVRGEVDADWEQLGAIAELLLALEYYTAALAEGVLETEALALASSKAEWLRQILPEIPPPLQGGQVLSAQQDPPPQAAEISLEADAPGGVEPGVETTPPAVPSSARPAPELRGVEDQIADPEIAAIFVEEAREVLETLAEEIPSWACDPNDRQVLESVRRGFHTLKGSGRMAGALVIGEFAWTFEQLLNRFRDGRLGFSPQMLRLVEMAQSRLPAMVDCFEQGATYPDRTALDQLAACAAAAAAGDVLSDDELTQLDCTDTASQPEEPVSSAQINTAEPENGDRELLEIFAEEAGEHLQAVADIVEDQASKAPFYDPVSSGLQRALHTLKGGANIADIRPLAQLVVPVEKLVRDMLAYHKSFDQELVTLLSETVSVSQQLLTHLLRGDPAQLPDSAPLVGRAEELWVGHFGESDGKDQSEAVDLTFLHELMTGGLERVMEADRVLSCWQAGDSPDKLSVPELVVELGRLAEGARRAGYGQISDLATALGEACHRLQQQSGALDDQQHDVLQEAHELLLSMIDAVAAQQTVPAATEQTLAALAAVGTRSDSQTDAVDGGSTLLPEDADREIVELFLEEAEELLEGIEQALSHWREAPREKAHSEALKRELHTFKGGARMAGLTGLGSFSHDLEATVIAKEAAVHDGDVAPISEFFAGYDRLATDIATIRSALTSPVATHQSDEPPAPVPESRDQGEDGTTPAYIGRQRGLEQAAEQLDSDSGNGDEVVRVAAPLLESLVNLAGESSITRSQVEQHVSEFAASLEEMEATIRRLQDQVRRLGVETDAQVLFRQEQIEASHSKEGFDPLEMDHYSQLQQLSRSLLESTSDLQDLRNTLVYKSRDTEGLLLQQSRIQAELQEGLSRTRLVPFSRMVPRLRRIVRQVAAATGREVNLVLEGTEGKIDRTLLERMIPSIEHMIRNAIDHGIEASSLRRDLGKPAEGTLSLHFAREAGDIAISLSDDGRGLDLAAIRSKAKEKGLVAPDQTLDDQALAQLIFVPGFSTASDVTETSGRGVGMDVVANEIRQLGGTVTIDSQAGQGTTFTLKFPFTLSVNRALMVMVGGDAYGLALKSVSGVTRIPVQDLQHHYYNPGEPFRYAGETYDIVYLGSQLSDDLFPVLDTAMGQLPLVLVRTEGRNYALHVDGLIGSQEVVVKSLGRQFGTVQGLSGAAILGDGRVVVILDPLSLLRDARTLAPPRMPVASSARVDAPEVPTVMVVDDSVTVRKVTGRLLERQGFTVVTARDGVEAMRLLQEMTPDIMLLDIEMPRMDGFEVARLVRSTPRLKSLPIIMITSRTGEKHRQKAFDLGVNQYLGKPYQEDELLGHIHHYLHQQEPRGETVL